VRKQDYADNWSDELQGLAMDGCDDETLFRRVRIAIRSAYNAGATGSFVADKPLPETDGVESK